MCRQPLLALTAAATLAAAAPSAQAIGTVDLAVERLEGRGVYIDGLVVSLAVWPAEPTARVTIDRLHLPPPVGALTDLSASCAQWALDAGVLTGRRCRLSANHETLSELTVAGELRYTLASRALAIDFDDLPLAGGSLRGAFSLGDGGWQASLAGTLDAEALRAMLAPWSPLLAEIAGSGSLALDAALADDGEAATARLTLTASAVAFANERGTAAGEGLEGGLEVDARRPAPGADWALSAAANVGGGEAFFEPVYLNFSTAPLTARVDTTLGADGQPTGATAVRYRHRDTLSVDADIAAMTTRPYRLESADIRMTQARFPQAYLGYLRGFLVGTPLSRLQTEGEARGELTIRDGKALRAELELDALGADDPAAGFALYDVGGALHWRSAETAADAVPVSELSVGGAFLADVSIGASPLRARLHGAGWRLLHPVRLPVFEGALEVKRFAVDGIGRDDLSFEFEAELEPIGLRRLTTALNWPVFPGKLSGRLPLLSYQNGQVTLGGTLEATAFDGSITLENLRVEQPFGVVPELDGTVRMRNLDLAQLTDVFTIGRIEGRLDADIVDLKMLKGQPVAFDARFYTTPGDGSRHRISQRAVGSISGIAGDSRTPALSTGFMRFFSDFAYERLGINCRLQNDVCNMSGIEPADQGYYLVKGRSLPRIDVIGFTRKVEWTRFVNQVRQALESGQTATGDAAGSATDRATGATTNEPEN